MLQWLLLMQTLYIFFPLNLPIAERNLEVKRNGILLLTRNWLVFAWDKIPLHCIPSGGLNFPLQQPLYKFSWGTKDLQNCFTIFHLLGHPSNYPIDCKEVLHSGISSFPNSILQFIHAHKQQQNLLASIHYGVQDNDKRLQKDSKKRNDFTLEDLGKTNLTMDLVLQHFISFAISCMPKRVPTSTFPTLELGLLV